MAKAKEVSAQITQLEFNEILQGLEIIEISVDEFSGKVHDRAGSLDPDLPQVIQLKESARYEEGSQSVAMWQTFKLTVTPEGQKTRKLFELSVTFRVLYHASVPISPKFFDVFKGKSLRLQTSPFARAWIHDHCLRMGMPPLILPLVRS